MKMLFFILLVLPLSSFGETRLNIDGNWTGDTSTLTASGAGSRSFILGGASFSAYTDSSIYFSAGMAVYSSVEPATATTTSTFSTIVPFAGLAYFFKKGQYRIASLGAYYVPSVSASYSETGTATETWSGSGYMGRLAIHPSLTSYMSVVFALNYLSLSFTNKSGTAVTTVSSFTRGIFIPTVGIEFFW